jgi:putative ABC transport system permease protein
MRQLLVENAILSILGGGLGLLGAAAAIRLFHLLRPIKVRIPRLDEVGIDGQVLCFTIGLSVMTALVFGLVPALRASKADVSRSLKAAGHTLAAGLSRQRTQHLLVIVESALASVLLVGAGLLINSFRLLQSVDPGFTPDGILVMDVWSNVPRDEMPRAVTFYSEVLERVRALPGVQLVDATNSSPLSGNNEITYFNERGLRAAEGEDRIHVQRRRIFSDYFRVVQIPLLRGRYFDKRDTEFSAPVAIINEAMARRFWPGEDPIGKRIPEEIVGVVTNVKHHGLASSAVPELYSPFRQNPNIFMQLLIRTSGDPKSLAGAVRREILATDSNARVNNITTLDRRIADSISSQRFTASVSGGFGFVAAILVTIGIYGIVAYFVSLRTHEIGIRIALGARSPEVLIMVIKYGLRLVLIGLSIGLLGAFALCRLISGFLYGIGPADLRTFGGASLLLVGITFIACYVPARRAVKVDPMEALRYE